MKIKMKKIVLITISILIVSGLLVYITLDVAGNIKNNVKKEGFEVILENKDICSLAINGETMWAGGSDGLFKINMATLDAKQIGNYSFVRSVLVSDKGIWVGHEDGLTFIGKTERTFTTKDGLPDNRVNAIMRAKDGMIWVGTWGGAAVLTDKIIRTYTMKKGLLTDMVNVIMEDNEGGIWFGSYVAPRGGISILLNDKWQYFTTDNALIHANINAIMQLKDKRVLAGGGLYTKGGGTYFVFRKGIWEKNGNLTKKDGLAGEKIRSLFEDSVGRLWIGSEYDGLSVLKDSTVLLTLSDKTGLSSNEVKAICEDSEGNIWAGTRNGLVKILRWVKTAKMQS